MIQLTLTLKMTTAQVVETSVTVNNNSPIQDYVNPDDQTQPTFARNNLCQGQKCPRNRTANKKNSSFELKNGLNLKLSLFYFVLSIQYYSGRKKREIYVPKRESGRRGKKA